MKRLLRTTVDFTLTVPVRLQSLYVYSPCTFTVLVRLQSLYVYSPCTFTVPVRETLKKPNKPEKLEALHSYSLFMKYDLGPSTNFHEFLYYFT